MASIGFTFYEFIIFDNIFLTLKKESGRKIVF